MSHVRRLSSLASSVLALTAVVFTPAAHAADPVTAVRLYTLDCGRMQIKDMDMFSDTGEYAGKPGTIADPCFVIRHPKGILLWDTGLPDKLAATKGGVDLPAVHQQRDATLIDELKGIGLTPADITYLSFSHTHFDHTGNANEFPDATWILNKAEIAWAETKPGWAVDLDSFSAYKTVKTQMVDGDYDVFGDHSVVILKTPGHTPGHQSLEVKLKKSGVVILSGDLWHLRDNYRFHRVPPFNTDRADTLASMDRISTLLKNSKGRLVVQHDAGDFDKMPKAPQYLD